MFTVAFIGPDGAGKSTISRHIEHRLPAPVRYLYMGVNTDSSNRMLPTTRLVRAIKRLLGGKGDRSGPRDHNTIAQRPRGLVKRFTASLRAGLSLANRMTEEWFRQFLAWYYQLRGYIVLFDRHYFVDYYAYDIAPTNQYRSLSRRLHGFMLQYLYPKPHLVIYLDAPAEVLFARKGEGTLDLLERRRQEYLQMRDLVPAFAVVDASQSPEQVAQTVVDIIARHHERRSAARPSDRDKNTAPENLDSSAVSPELAVLELRSQTDRLHVDA